MNYLIAGLAKSGTTMLFSRVQQGLDVGVRTFFEPDTQAQLAGILAGDSATDTLTKVLIGRVKADQRLLAEFDKHILIYRDPRDQFVSMLLYLFYDFQLNADQEGYDICFAALEKKQQQPNGFSAIQLYNLLAATVGRAPIAVFNNLHRVQKEYIEAFSPHKACYEKILAGQWDDLEAYLGLTLAVEASVPEEYSRVVRSKGYGDWRNWLNATDIEYTNVHWGEHIQALGYQLGEAEQNQIIEKKTTLEYVSQFNPQQSSQAQ